MVLLLLSPKISLVSKIKCAVFLSSFLAVAERLSKSGTQWFSDAEAQIACGGGVGGGGPLSLGGGSGVLPRENFEKIDSKHMLNGAF